MIPAEFGNLAARHKLVEIAEACRKEAKYSNWMAMNPASVQPVEADDGWHGDVAIITHNRVVGFTASIAGLSKAS